MSEVSWPSPNVWTNRILTIAFALGLAMSAVLGPCWWSTVREHVPSCALEKSDFTSFYSAAQIMRSDGSLLYDLERQRTVQLAIDTSRGEHVMPYFYPPFFAILLLPLAWLPFSSAFVAMTVVNLALLIVAVRILIKQLQLNSQQSICLVLVTFCNYGVHYALLEAQTSFIALALLVLYVTALNNPATNMAGVWSGLLFFKPQLALIPLILLVTRKKWTALALAIGVVGILSIVSLFAVGICGVVQYRTITQIAASGEAIVNLKYAEQPERMHNLRALTHFFFDVPWRRYLWWAASVVVVVVVVFSTLRRDGSGEISQRQWVAVLAGLMLFSPHLHDHDLTLLIVPMAVCLKLCGEVVRPAVAAILVAVSALSLVNQLAYPHLPPLLPLALAAILACSSVVNKYSIYSPSQLRDS